VREQTQVNLLSINTRGLLERARKAFKAKSIFCFLAEGSSEIFILDHKFSLGNKLLENFIAALRIKLGINASGAKENSLVAGFRVQEVIVGVLLRQSNSQDSSQEQAE